MTKMNDETLRRALQALPRDEAGEAFTRQVMARLPERASPKRLGVRFYWGLAAVTVATALIVAVAVPSFLRSAPPTSPGMQAGRSEQIQPAATGGDDDRLQRLLAERQEIVLELQRFRRESEAGRPVLYLGEVESVDFVVDLAEVARRRPAGAVQPAVHRSASSQEIF